MLIALALTALASTTPYDVCTKQADGVMPALKDCAAREQTARDGALNRAYQAALKGAGADVRPKLREAERAWVAFRDAECAYRLTSEGGGQEAALVWSDCRLGLTAARTSQLQSGMGRPPR